MSDLTELDWTAPPKSDPPNLKKSPWKLDPKPDEYGKWAIYSVAPGRGGIHLIAKCEREEHAHLICRLFNEANERGEV